MTALVALGALLASIVLVQRHAQGMSPNIGVVNVIVYSSALLTMIATALVYGDAVSPKMVFGAILVIAGLCFMTMDQLKSTTK